jgi:glycosyltransferase involved in cell wall biosynthesis
MAMAKPVVASDVGGHRELIEDGVSGILFPPGDSDGLARTLEALLRDPERARRIAVRASMDVAERFTWRHATAPYQAVYESALRHRSGRR